MTLLLAGIITVFGFEATIAQQYQTADRPHELGEQIARNKEYQLRAIQQLGEAGGCNADFIPYGYAVDCSAFLVNNAPFGGADNGQMGSTGD